MSLSVLGQAPTLEELAAMVASKRPGLDHGVRAQVPGYSEYATGAIQDIAPTPLDALALSGIPGIADAAGLASDMRMFRDDPESRTWMNAGLSALGALPLVPGVTSRLYHGGRLGDAPSGPLWGSKEPELANQYADARYVIDDVPTAVYPYDAEYNVSLNADQLPRTVTAGKFVAEAAQQAGMEDVRDLKTLFQRIQEGARREESGPSYAPQDFWYNPAEKFGSDGASAIDELLRRLGFDSITFTEAGNETVGLLNPRQGAPKLFSGGVE